MTDFNDDNSTDQLKSFLKKHQPKPPAAPAQELNSILQKIEPTAFFRFKWFMVPTSVAVGFLAFWISMQTPSVVVNQPPMTMAQKTVSNDAAVGLLDDDDFDLFEDESPTLQIGEDYLTLAEL